jgi:hypothetical protein
LVGADAHREKAERKAIVWPQIDFLVAFEEGERRERLLQGSNQNNRNERVRRLMTGRERPRFRVRCFPTTTV